MNWSVHVIKKHIGNFKFSDVKRFGGVGEELIMLAVKTKALIANLIISIIIVIKFSF